MGKTTSDGAMWRGDAGIVDCGVEMRDAKGVPANKRRKFNAKRVT